ncbi:DUF6493 family protein [Nonomuraea dietziae]|uniref:DUF6493 family protein n=1 Tax=Nonomuraea dietziae TaxID=65515 RepID=UPI0034494493
MSAWESVRAALATDDVTRLAACVAALDDAGRREVAAVLPGHISAARAQAEARLQARERTRRDSAERRSQERWALFQREADRRGWTQERRDHEWEAHWQPGRRLWHEEEEWGDEVAWMELMRVAGAGTLGGPAAVVAWLNRRDLEPWTEQADDLEPLLQVLSVRPAAWQADVAARLVRRARNARNRNLRLALELLRANGVTPPEHDPLVVAWASGAPTARALRDDPLLPVLLPRLFEAEGVGRALRHEKAAPLAAGTWLATLRVLESEGTVSREMLLDGCLRRFLRGGTATDLRFFARLHDLIEPAYDEVAARARDYVRLLPSAPGPVAELALRHLRRLGDLPEADVAEALGALLSRPERKLATAGLRWLDEAADELDDLDALAPALGLAFACGSWDVQCRAARTAVRHSDRFSPMGAEAVREALPLLPASVAGSVAAAFGDQALSTAGG